MWKYLLKKLALTDTQMNERGRVNAFDRDLSPALQKRFSKGELSSDAPDDVDMYPQDNESGADKRDYAVRDMDYMGWARNNPRTAEKNFLDRPDAIERNGAPSRASEQDAVDIASDTPSDIAKGDALAKKHPEIFANPDSRGRFHGRRYNIAAYRRYEKGNIEGTGGPNAESEDSARADAAYEAFVRVPKK